MKSLKKTIGIIYCLAGTCLHATSSFAAEGAHEAITFMGDWLPRLVNFSIIAAVVVYFAKKPIRDFFAARTAEIAKAMVDSKETRERAVFALAEMERKVREMEAETRSMVADAQARGEKDRQVLIEEGGKVALDVQVLVKRGIEIEVQKARSALAVEASLLSLELAEGRIKEKIGSQDHERIVKEYIANVGGRA